jgi:hypothetical protein
MSILALTSDTLIGTPASGNIEYNGQFFGTDSNASRAQLQRIVRATAVTCAGQTSIDFTGIPAWAEKISVIFNGISTSGTSGVLVQVGDSGGVENTGYVSGTSNIASGAVGTLVTSTAGFVAMSVTAAASTNSGVVTLFNVSGNIWVASGTMYYSGSSTFAVAGNKTLSDVLDRVRVTTINGTDTFDTTPSAGSINIIYEG